MQTRTTNASGLNRPTQLRQMLPIKQIKRKKSPLEQVSDFSDSDPERPPESASEDDDNASQKPDFKRQRGSSSSKHPQRRDRKNESPRRCSSPNPQPNLAELLPAGFLDTEFLPLPAVSEEVKNWRRERRAEKIAKESPNKVRFGKIGDIDIDELVREAAGEKDAGNEMSKCSTCNQMVLSSRLKAFSEGKPLSVRRMIDFCELHTRQDAEDAWVKQKLPKIEWDGLALRVHSFKDTLADIVTGKRKSEFRNQLTENIKAHQKLNIATERPPLGYYGIRGMYCVQEVIYSILGKMIQKQALIDKAVSSRGWMFFTESVLVPEALIRLIMEDKDMDETEALECLKSTTWIGDALSQEVQDVVEPLHHVQEGEVSYFSHDSEEDEEDEEGEEDEEADEEEEYEEADEEEESLRAIQERVRITHDFDRDFADSDDEP
ncbi:hypothetical protein Cpir12675_003703 [Ceratocystis pirilliformis]|uniref:Restriction of telomere capping protein 4 n=1 Tax=Ceratocystis pirilliformis TaxID=259994 RepID=A0ABR3Z112_9PEZI